MITYPEFEVVDIGALMPLQGHAFACACKLIDCFGFPFQASNCDVDDAQRVQFAAAWYLRLADGHRINLGPSEWGWLQGRRPVCVPLWWRVHGMSSDVVDLARFILDAPTRLARGGESDE